VADLLPFCEPDRVIVVGSVRRLKPIVHDIELIVIPKTAPMNSLFGDEMGRVSLLENAWPELVRKWNAQSVKAGPKYKKVLLPEGLHLEINISDPVRWGVEMVIKTGPAEFSHKCVTIRQQSGWLPSNCVIKDGWKVYQNGNPVAMPTEEKFLDFIGLGWIDPKDRQ
jgi:DNA polymerase/3'-5' exonuclease PolX